MASNQLATLAEPLPEGTLGGTEFAPPYKSIFSLQSPIKNVLPNMTHVNCSYLSTPGVAPTLTHLKQHAQSLCILIKYLTVNTLPGVINNAESDIAGVPTFSDGETYDFLNDLSRPYTGPTNPALHRHYAMPLTALLNVLQEPTHSRNRNMYGHDDCDHEDDDLVEYSTDICPLHSAHPSDVAENQPSLPYATHQALIQHANAVLELLDHEYSAKGGLLSILPPPEQTEDRAKAEATLLGQLIIYMQRLVQRVHELERQYANAMDALAGEAVVPSQTLSKLGPDGRVPREMVYPQDRFVLVNAGEDVWRFLHQEFEKKEVVDEYVAEQNLKNGVSGQTAWQNSGGKEYSRGITAVDITTRYYRLRKDPLKTIFVVPAHADHPGTQTTIRMENEPTVVNVVKPVWPERASMWEMKHRAELKELKQLRQDHQVALQTVQVKTTAEQLLLTDNKVKDATISNLKNEIASIKTYLALPESQRQRDLVDQITQVNADRLAAVAAAQANTNRQTQLDTDIAALAANQAALNTAVQQQQAAAAAQNTAHQATLLQWQTDAAARNADQGRIHADLNDRLGQAWRIRMNEVEVLSQYLRDKAALVTTDQPSAAIIRQATADSDALIDRIFGPAAPAP